MGLYERWTADDDTKIPIHDFFGFLHIWLHDSEGLGSAAGSLAVTNLNLAGDDVTEAQAIKAKFDALGTDAAKLEFAARINAVVLLCESGHITKAQAKLALGF